MSTTEVRSVKDNKVIGYIDPSLYDSLLHIQEDIEYMQDVATIGASIHCPHRSNAITLLCRV